MPSILIATPTAGDIAKSCYTGCVAKTLTNLHSHNVRTHYMTVDYSGIARLRDAFAHQFLQSDFTHLLCIDSDMEFAEDLAWKMLSFDLPFVGTIYTGAKFRSKK